MGPPMPKPSDHPAASNPEQLITECELWAVAGRDRVGQHRNKVETAISLHHLPTGVRAEASDSRSQAQNRSVALFRLRVNLALEVRRPCDPNYVPSPLWQARCGSGVLKLSVGHDDFPSPAGRGTGRAGGLGRRPEAGGCRAWLHAVAVSSTAELRPVAPWLCSTAGVVIATCTRFDRNSAGGCTSTRGSWKFLNQLLDGGEQALFLRKTRWRPTSKNITNIPKSYGPGLQSYSNAVLLPCA